MRPILFSIGPINFYSYGFMVSIAFFVTMGIFYLLARSKKLWHKDTFTRFIISLIYVLVFARLAFFFAYYDKYFTNWWEVFYFWNGGLVSYGGIIGMILAFIILFRPRLLENLDILGVAVLGGGIFWRIGGILAGSYPTKVSQFFWTVNGGFPAVEVESILLLIGFLIFYFLYKKNYFQSGNIFFAVIGYYGLLRIFLDQYRIYPVLVSSVNIGQFIGILFLVISIISIVLLKIIRVQQKDSRS